MDDLNSTFGRLSTKAVEWIPKQMSNSINNSPNSASRNGGGSGGGSTSINSHFNKYNSNSNNSSCGSNRSQMYNNNNHINNIHNKKNNNFHSSTNSLTTTTTTAAVESDLNPTTVKEFVPGHGWSSTASTSTALTVPTTTASSSSTTSTATTSGSANLTVLDECQPIQQPFQRNRQFHSSNHNQHQQQQQEVFNNYNHQQAKIYETTIANGACPAPSLPEFRALHSLGLSDDVWRYYRDIALDSARQMDPYDPLHRAVPPPYCNAFCLDPPVMPPQRGRGRSAFFGYPTTTFQVTNRDDGYLYSLKRFDSVRSVSTKIAVSVTDQWNNTCTSSLLDHPGIVPFYQCFVAQRAVFFVHQYIPKAHTLKEIIDSGTSFAEPILWSVLTQLVSAIRTIHSNNLAVRCLRLRYILTTTDAMNTRLRVRIGSLGVVDALEFEARKHISDLQSTDIQDLGRLLLSLAAGTEITTNTEASIVHQCEAYVAQNYSLEFQNLVLTMANGHGSSSEGQGGNSGSFGNGSSTNNSRQQQHMRPPPRPLSIMDVCVAIAQHACCFEEQDAAYRSYDRIDRELIAEYDSGRALRLLLKLGFINERPEYGLNRRWAHSGDCYVLALFRDYVFHQADGAGNPVLDLGHVITSLNKLDAADEEKIVLSSRDGVSLMVVSYADIARCLENAYKELCTGAVPWPRTPTAGGGGMVAMEQRLPY